MSKRWMLAVCAALAVGAVQADVNRPAAPSIKAVQIDMGPGCRIRLVVPAAARVSGSPERGGSGSVTVENPLGLVTKRYVAPFWLPFICHDADSKVVTDGWGKRLSNGEWVASVPEADEVLFKGATRAHQVHAVNASGWAVAVDDVIGEERYRSRKLYYCVIHTVKAVCGHSEMGLLAEIRRNPRHDLTTYALKILRSIEFIEDAVPAAPSASQPVMR
ncbi:hypothetical protein [Caldimonas sp.]|uniref:hypothetical protein n=1 Tax=Caldimonas sp. TaxID=2838790 RepID=UPI003919C9F0